MDYNIVVLSHGYFCQEIIKSAEMIVGPISNAYAVPLPPDMDGESYMTQLRSLIESFEGKPFICLVDIMGGTPYNSCLRLMQDYDFSLVTNLCLMMLLEAPFASPETVEEFGELMDSVSHSGTRLYSKDFRASLE